MGDAAGTGGTSPPLKKRKSMLDEEASGDSSAICLPASTPAAGGEPIAGGERMAPRAKAAILAATLGQGSAAALAQKAADEAMEAEAMAMFPDAFQVRASFACDSRFLRSQGLLRHFPLTLPPLDLTSPSPLPHFPLTCSL